MNAQRRPHLSKSVAAGLESLATRIVPTTEDEAIAIVWIYRTKLWRSLSSEPLEPQDADDLSPERGAGESRLRRETVYEQGDIE